MRVYFTLEADGKRFEPEPHENFPYMAIQAAQSPSAGGNPVASEEGWREDPYGPAREGKTVAFTVEGPDAERALAAVKEALADAPLPGSDIGKSLLASLGYALRSHDRRRVGWRPPGYVTPSRGRLPPEGPAPRGRPTNATRERRAYVQSSENPEAAEKAPIGARVSPLERRMVEQWRARGWHAVADDYLRMKGG